MKSKKTFLIITILTILLCSFIIAENYVEDTLSQGQTETYTLEGKEYKIKAHYINLDSNYASFLINGKTTKGIFVDKSLTLADDSIITVLDTSRLENDKVVKFGYSVEVADDEELEQEEQEQIDEVDDTEEEEEEQTDDTEVEEQQQEPTDTQPETPAPAEPEQIQDLPSPSFWQKIVNWFNSLFI